MLRQIAESYDAPNGNADMDIVSVSSNDSTVLNGILSDVSSAPMLDVQPDLERMRDFADYHPSIQRSSISRTPLQRAPMPPPRTTNQQSTPRYSATNSFTPLLRETMYRGVNQPPPPPSMQPSTSRAPVQRAQIQRPQSPRYANPAPAPNPISPSYGPGPEYLNLQTQQMQFRNNHVDSIDYSGMQYVRTTADNGEWRPADSGAVELRAYTNPPMNEVLIAVSINHNAAAAPEVAAHRAEKCPICNDPVMAKLPRVGKECGHLICAECVESWMRAQTEMRVYFSCPLCRKRGNFVRLFPHYDGKF